jgi:hypothetical protein
MVRTFDFFSGKAGNFRRQKKGYASRLETASVIKIVTENGRIRYGTVRYGTVRYATVRYGTVRYGTARYGTVRYGTLRYGIEDKFGAPTVYKKFFFNCF